MKRVVLIEILLFLSFCVLLSLCIIFLHGAAERFETAGLAGDPNSFWWEIAHEYFALGFPCLIAAISNLGAMILIAIKEFKVFQPIIDRHNARKSERTAAKQAKAEADKQKEIAELEAKLNELKKDDE